MLVQLFLAPGGRDAYGGATLISRVPRLQDKRNICLSLRPGCIHVISLLDRAGEMLLSGFLKASLGATKGPCKCIIIFWKSGQLLGKFRFIASLFIGLLA